MENIIFVNITWNPNGWKEIYINNQAGHSYASVYPGHECLNFNFNKVNIDSEKYIHGYVQWTKPPVYFNNDGIIIFYTKNIETGLGEIIGVYGRANIIQKQNFPYIGFKDNTYFINIRAIKDYSVLFPFYLNAEKYKEDGERFIGQIGFSYKNDDLVKNIIMDEILELKKHKLFGNEYIKLVNIFNYYFGEINFNTNDIEQTELITIFANKTKEQLINELQNDNDEENDDFITVNHKQYKRNNVNIAKIKLIRGFSCQICGMSIVKKDGTKYIEAAHIKAKSKGGKETLSNIILLCPNHHKEFDLGNSKIITHDQHNVKLIINNNEYEIML